jgi:hypothetical protein
MECVDLVDGHHVACFSIFFNFLIFQCFKEFCKKIPDVDNNYLYLCAKNQF